MANAMEIMKPVSQFVAGETERICRLCFTSTQNDGTDLKDSAKLDKYYCNEELTFEDMFLELDVPIETDLPQTLCVNCVSMTINSYLFKRLIKYSESMWKNFLNKLDFSLNLSETTRANAQTIYIIMGKNNTILKSRKKQVTNKKEALTTIKDNIKSRQKYVKVKNKNVTCDDCGERFKAKWMLKRHMKNRCSTKCSCPQCPKDFSTYSLLKGHIERMHHPKRIKCKKCPKMFSTEKLLHRHDKMYHLAAICKLCFVQFPSGKDLKVHLDKHEVYKCPRCDKSLLNKNTLKFHLKICGNDDSKKLSFFCDICKKGYARKNGLRTHLKTEHGFGNSLSCKWCSKKFDAVSRLRNHTVKHTKERNYHCEHCGNRFVTQAALVYHTRLHTGEKPFPCDMCEESFLSASRRMEHKRRKHLGPSKECPVCHTKFITTYCLKKHLERHYNPQSKLYILEPDINIDHLSVNDVKQSMYLLQTFI